MMHGRGKSDSVVVAVKLANKAEQPAAEQSATEPAPHGVISFECGLRHHFS